VGQVYPELDQRLVKFIASQPVFFVATAPCLDSAGQGGHVNFSPTGYRDTFAVLDPLTVAYLGPHRQRRGDHRAPAAERPDNADVLLLRRGAEGAADLRDGPGGLAG